MFPFPKIGSSRKESAFSKRALFSEDISLLSSELPQINTSAAAIKTRSTMTVLSFCFMPFTNMNSMLSPNLLHYYQCVIR
jgi:hypothetical protein